MLEIWRRYRQAQITQRLSLEDELRKLDGKVEQLKLMDRLVETDNDSMVKAYKTRIKKPETDRTALIEKSAQSPRPMRSCDAALRSTLDFISNPHKLWSSEAIAQPPRFRVDFNTTEIQDLEPLKRRHLSRDIGGLSSKRFQLAETECETSNRILEILEEWNDYLKNNVSYYQEPSP